jgi:hypothetical protein
LFFAEPLLRALGGNVRLSRKTIATLGVVVFLVALFVMGVVRWDWGRFIVETAQQAHEDYGINIPLAIALFGVGEVVFIGSIAMMLKVAGEQVTWSSVHAFKLKNLNLGSRRMAMWLWVNRLSWIVPWLVIIAMSITKVPWWATLAALGEVAVTFSVGVVISLGLRLPWWNGGEPDA